MVSLGTGSRALVERNNDWRRVQGRTARGIFSSFCDALSGGTDPHSGGAPQLVGLYPRSVSYTHLDVYKRQKERPSNPTNSLNSIGKQHRQTRTAKLNMASNLSGIGKMYEVVESPGNAVSTNPNGVPDERLCNFA